MTLARLDWLSRFPRQLLGLAFEDCRGTRVLATARARPRGRARGSHKANSRFKRTNQFSKTKRVGRGRTYPQDYPQAADYYAPLRCFRVHRGVSAGGGGEDSSRVGAAVNLFSFHPASQRGPDCSGGRYRSGVSEPVKDYFLLRVLELSLPSACGCCAPFRCAPPL